jgi:hypothetical protein
LTFRKTGERDALSPSHELSGNALFLLWRQDLCLAGFLARPKPGTSIIARDETHYKNVHGGVLQKEVHCIAFQQLVLL